MLCLKQEEGEEDAMNSGPLITKYSYYNIAGSCEFSKRMIIRTKMYGKKFSSGIF